jgi:hypothetical protein
MSERTVPATFALEHVRETERLLAQLAPTMKEFATGLANVTAAVVHAGEGLEHVLRAAKKLDSRDAPEEPGRPQHNHTGWGARADCPACRVIWDLDAVEVDTPPTGG